MAGTGALAAKGKNMVKKLDRPIALQLYTLGDEPGKDLDGVWATLTTIGYRNLELPSLFGKSPTVLRGAADKAGVKISAIHLSAIEGVAGGGGALSMLSPT